MNGGLLTSEQTERVIALAMDLVRTTTPGICGSSWSAGCRWTMADEGAHTLLMLAACHAHANAVRALLELGADPDLPHAHG